MSKYEYVPKSEYQPVREELEKIIKKVQKLVKLENKEFTFQFNLVGSGSRKLITRIKNGNKGFDFDYNLILNKPDPEHYWKADYAKQLLMRAFKEVVKGTSYDNPEDSTVSITIKTKDFKNSKIKYSCDFAVVYYPEDDDTHYMKYVKFNKKGNMNYTWEVRQFTRNIDDKLDWLKDNIEDYWLDIKDEYLKVKESNNDLNKHSFQLYYEAVANVYNHYTQDDYYDDEDDEDYE